MDELPTLRLALSTLPEDASLELDCPVEALGLTIAALLDEFFPEDVDAQAAVENSFDLRETPDLPEIYSEFLRVIEQRRHGLCELQVRQAAEGGLAVVEVDQVPFATPQAEGSPTVELALTPVYRSLEFARRQGYTAGEPDLVEWLQVCLAMYFLDKHECNLPSPDSLCEGNAVSAIASAIYDSGLASYDPIAGLTAITQEGRHFIGSLIEETELLIDDYDLFRDVYWDWEADEALFETGHGEDLRVEVYEAEGIDPVRAVFLLRLYDGSVDGFVSQWQERITDTDFLSRLLEPVVDRSITPPGLAAAGNYSGHGPAGFITGSRGHGGQ